MTKGLKISLILILFSNCLFSQVDGIKKEILDYDYSKSILISKGRKMLLDKFIEGDFKKVKEIKDYLIETEDKDYFAFYPPEYWFILYWTKDYAELVESIQQFDSVKVASYNTRIRPLNDMLFSKLKKESFNNEIALKRQLQDSELDSETKKALCMNLDWLLIENRETIYAQDSLNEQADHFLETYAQSKFEDFTRTYIRYKLVPSDWGMAFEFFSGYGVYTGNLRDTYTNSIPIGVAFDICYH